MPHPSPFSTAKLEREAALAFLSVRGVGPATLVQLARNFGSLAEAFQAEPRQLDRHLRSEAKQALADQPSLRSRLEKTLARVADHQASVIFRGDPGWPLSLADLGPGEPVVLFVRGNLRLDRRCVAVVGSREADLYGRSRARGLGARLGTAGLVTVSGGARGVDGEAHRGALEAHGTTFAVLGSGFDFPFPPAHIPLFDQIAAEGGAVISEFPPTHETKQGNFPRRNNLVAALGEATVVVRGDIQSGALLTAGDAHRLRRQLLAVPGAVDLAQSRGPHLLLRLGWAKPCCDFADVLRSLGLAPPLDDRSMDRNRPEPAEMELELDLLPPRRGEITKPPTLNGPASEVWDVLQTTPLHFDALVVATRLSVASLSVVLTQMEIDGHAEQVPGKRFVRREKR